MNAPLSSLWFVGASSKKQELIQQVARIASQDIPVLITGAVGSGHSNMAQVLHAQSARSKSPCITLHCAANNNLAPELDALDNGYDQDEHVGGKWLECARDGTLVLENIEFLSELGQGRLAALYDRRDVQTSSSQTPTHPLCNIICTTTVDLAQRCEEGKFWMSLYYKLSVASIELPVLKERIDDLPDICEQMLHNIARQHRLEVPELDTGVARALRNHEWHGNLRELHNVLQRALLLSKGATSIGVKDLVFDKNPSTPPPVLSIATEAHTHVAQNGTAHPQNNYTEEGVSLEDYFQSFVLRHQDSMSETELARKLGISRKCLWERRQRFGIARKTNASEQKG